VTKLNLYMTQIETGISHHTCSGVAETVRVHAVRNAGPLPLLDGDLPHVCGVDLLPSTCTEEVVAPGGPDVEPRSEELDSWCAYPDRAALASLALNDSGRPFFKIHVAHTERQRFVAPETTERESRKYCTIAYAAI